MAGSIFKDPQRFYEEMSKKTTDVSVVIPCLNEEKALGVCIKKIKNVFKKGNIFGEIIVVDNGSTDRSPDIALEMGAKVVSQPIKGYGAAYLSGFEEAKGKYIVMGDGDNSYDFEQIPNFIDKLDQGFDLVIGSRFKGKILKGAMPFSHRYLGNPILTALLNLFFKSYLSDAHSGFRAIKKDVLHRLNLQTIGMEFASEMIITALKERIKIAELPIWYYPREGASKLKPLYDAWRHLRFMLLFSPDWLFMVPGLSLFFVGMGGTLLSSFGLLNILGHKFDIHAMIFFSFFALLGFQILNLGLFAKTYSWLEKYEKKDRTIEQFHNWFSLEKGILIGIISFLIGFFPSAYTVIKWVGFGFGPLQGAKIVLLGVVFMIIGVQLVFSSFFLSLLGISKKTD